MSELMGGEAGRLFAALDREPVVSIRLNRLKLAAVSSFCELSPAARVPWATDGFYLSSRPAFTYDPLFHAGAYYVQEASSMFAGLALRSVADVPLRMLDLCAAPGGKSTLYRSLLPEGSLLVANEPMRQRVRVLAENLAKWGHPDVVVTNNFPADFAPLSGFFDVVAVDAPCSGEGMFRKDAQAVSEWSEANVEMCSRRQREIVGDVWPALRPGGYLLYSTCTYNTHENEENVAWIAETLGADVVRLSVDEDWGITGNLLSPSGGVPVYRFLPHKTCGEGLFVALLRKHEGESGRSLRMRRGRRPEAKAVVPAVCKEWLVDGRRFSWERNGAVVSAVREALAADVAALRDVLRVVCAGVTVAEEKGRAWIPQQELALSTVFNADAFPRAELDYGAALSYLRGEAVVLPREVPCGLVCLTYRNLPLGFAKNLGNRANNLYPDAWRIRSSHLPDEPPRVC